MGFFLVEENWMGHSDSIAIIWLSILSEKKEIILLWFVCFYSNKPKKIVEQKKKNRPAAVRLTRDVFLYLLLLVSVIIINIIFVVHLARVKCGKHAIFMRRRREIVEIIVACFEWNINEGTVNFSRFTDCSHGEVSLVLKILVNWARTNSNAIFPYCTIFICV